MRCTGGTTGKEKAMVQQWRTAPPARAGLDVLTDPELRTFTAGDEQDLPRGARERDGDADDARARAVVLAHAGASLGERVRTQG